MLSQELASHGRPRGTRCRERAPPFGWMLSRMLDAGALLRQVTSLYLQLLPLSFLFLSSCGNMVELLIIRSDV